MTFFWGESIGRKRMIMAGASTMLVGTVGPPPFGVRGKLIDLWSGDSHEFYHPDPAVRWAYRNRNSERITFALTAVQAHVTLYLQGNGFNSSSIPVYQSETCGGMIRGALVCLNSTITIVGLVIVSRSCS